MNIALYDNINDIYGEENVSRAKEDIYALWQECFGDSKEYTDFYFKWKIKDNKVLTIYKKESLCSMIHLNPYLLSVRNQQIPANYIVGVATKKEERRQGFMKILLEKALYKMYLDKMPFTYLMPATEAIYAPYDFRVIYEQEPWNEIMKTAIEDRREKIKTISEDSNIIVKPLHPKDTPSINELISFCNKQLSETCHIYVYRTPNYYERLIHEMQSGYGEVLVCYRNEQILGCLSYMAEEAVYITEMIANNKDREAVLEAFAKYLMNIPKKVYENQEQKKTTIMARIVDFKSFIKNITATEEIQIVMEVKDAILDENNGIYQLNFTKEGGTIVETTKEPEISLDIAEATKLFFGRLQWDTFVNEHKIIQTKVCNSDIGDKLDKINSYSQVFINDVV